MPPVQNSGPPFYCRELMLVEREPLALSAAIKLPSNQPDSVRPRASELTRSACESEGVLGVRCQGDTGVRRFGFEAPGRARPACSRCSATVSITFLKTVRLKAGRSPSVQFNSDAMICST